MTRTTWQPKPGTWIRLQASSGLLGKFGRITAIDDSALIYAETDGCPEVALVRRDFRIIRTRKKPHSWFPMRRTLPHGRVFCADGSFVLLNSCGLPLIKVDENGHVSTCPPSDQIAYETREWFWGQKDTRPPWRSEAVFKACVSIMERPQDMASPSFRLPEPLAAFSWPWNKNSKAL